MTTNTPTTPRPASAIGAAATCLIEATDELNRGDALVGAMRLAVDALGADREDKAALAEIVDTVRDELATIAESERALPEPDTSAIGLDDVSSLQRAAS